MLLLERLRAPNLASWSHDARCDALFAPECRHVDEERSGNSPREGGTSKQLLRRRLARQRESYV